MRRDVSMDVGAATRVTIDRSRCCGYALCAEICPDVYGLDESGFAVANVDEVPGDLLERAREGAEACPEEAIRLSSG
jgi:ferredoxin